MQKRWQIAPRLPQSAEKELHGYPPVLRQILYNRGYATQESARQFLEARLPPGTQPSAMGGVDAAVERLVWAIQKNERIAIYGDYDADGVTATALLVQFLENLGAEVQGYIPNRFDEGYGLNNDALKTLHESGVRLVITVDCGIRSLPEVAYGNSLGLDIIVTDHHQPTDQLPEALAVINPKQPSDSYPEKELAGVGLAYKLASGLEDYLKKQGDRVPDHCQAGQYLDLVALGTIADLAPLIGENRALVGIGLEHIRQPHRQGIWALINVAEIAPQKINASEIGYILAPRLNAAGRLESALAAFKLLVTQDAMEAGSLALQLDRQNRERQEITRQISAKAEELALAHDPEPLLLFAGDAEFNPGVVGLAASRLVEVYYRPAIVAQLGSEFSRGSCRSIPEFHITQALDQCADLLVHHGGHAAAAGFTVHNRHLPTLIDRLKDIARQQLSHLDLRPTLVADMELPLSELKPELLEYLAWLQPTGYGNPDAVFVTRDLRVLQYRCVGKEGAHLKLAVTDGRITYDAIAFRQGHWQAEMPKVVDLIYNFELNIFNGQKYLQLNVRDLKPAGSGQ